MSAGWQRLSARLQAAGIIALAVFVFYRASRMSSFGTDPGSPGVFPALVALVLLVCALLIWRERPAPGGASPAADGGGVTATALIAALMAIAYGVVLRKLGFIGASVLYLAASFLWLRASAWWKSILLAGVAVAITFVVFRHVFLVILP
ncbi:MAG: tripartite tricarboxylate transporter TctB family protein [Armatimonadota bacterium]|nr:tripartite tricarboxylate transporter TctB family protein [Armatimonadota bacterium]MDR7420983.1 tripartite tricarboxylate transporter TctB family protein [Armatimonadota bacterium]MDR7497406.1 tripartite tricarboxylate transporter TctB family protein [Armatimonadota bacterium]MDR7511893.1 tripartite tricarboxylate transporter TctB family protein [Armatimonadota bacterium]